MPENIGRYRIVEELGRGTMGVVYRAIDPVIGREVALKTLRSADGLSPEAYAEMRERFLREARAAGRLRHPHIVSVLDAGTEEATATAYIAMEYVPGRDLEGELRAGRRFTPDESAEIIAGVAEALDLAHQGGIIHRDVKPANLLIDAAGQARITDFGVAHLPDSGLTRAGQVMGSPAYMSPEQIMGAVLDARSDIFSLGVVLYELLTGERPFPGEMLSTVAYHIVHSVPAPPTRLNPLLPASYEPVVWRALAKDPAARFPTAGELARALRQARAEAPVAAGQAPAGQPLAPVGAGPTGTLPAATPATGITATVAAAAAQAGTRSASPAAARRWLLLSTLAVALLVALVGRLAPGAGQAVDTGTQPPATPVVVAETAPTPGPTAPPPTVTRPAAARTRREAAATPTVTPAAPTPATALATSRLLVDLEHQLPSGSVTLLADGAEIWRAPLAAREDARRRLTTESLRADLEAPAGVRILTVTIASPEGGVESHDMIRAELPPARTQRLKIRISRRTGKLSLELKP